MNEALKLLLHVLLIIWAIKSFLNFMEKSKALCNQNSEYKNRKLILQHLRPKEHIVPKPKNRLEMLMNRLTVIISHS